MVMVFVEFLGSIVYSLHVLKNFGYYFFKYFSASTLSETPVTQILYHLQFATSNEAHAFFFKSRLFFFSFSATVWIFVIAMS